MISGTITDLSGAPCPAKRPRPSGTRCSTEPFSIGLQLRLRCRAAQALGRRDGARRRHLHQRLSQCRSAQRVGRVRREPGGHGRPCWRTGRATGWINIVGGCCGTTPEHIRAIADCRCEISAARTCRRSLPSSASPASNPSAGSSEARLTSSTRTTPQNFVKSASAPTSPAPPFRKLIEANTIEDALAVARQQVESGAKIIDVNMDEGMLDSEEAMVTLPQSDRRRTRYLPRADHDRLLEMDGDRGRSEMRAGQGDRQFHQPEGRRGTLSSTRAQSPPIRCGRGGDGLRRNRARPRRLSARFDICERAYDLLTEKSASRPKTSSSIRTSSPSPPASRSTTTTPSTIIEATRRIKADAAPRACVGRRVESLLLLPRQRSRCARRCTPCSSITPSKPAWTWASSTPASWRFTKTSSRELRELVEDVILNRRPDATERLVEAAETLQRRRGTDSREDDLMPGARAGRRAPDPRAGERHRRIISTKTPKKRAPRADAPAARHRRPADGRHERGRRSVRRRARCSCRRW